METYKGYTIEIETDEYPMNPREWDNDSKMVCFHKRYDLPCEIDIDHNNFNSWDEIEEYIKENYKVTDIKPVYMYDHSGITVKTTPFSCSWDSGQIGFIFTEEREIGSVLEQDIETYNNYITGNVHGYNIILSNGEESCWGFYGDIEESGLLEEAKNRIDYDIEQKQKIKELKLKQYIVNHVPLQYRFN